MIARVREILAGAWALVAAWVAGAAGRLRGGAGSVDPGPLEVTAEAGDRPIGEGYPQGVDTGSQVKRLHAALWGLGGLVVLLTVIAVAQGVALARLIPLKQVEPWVYEVHPERAAVVRVRPLTDRKQSLQMYLRAEVKRFVIYRHAVIPSMAAMEERIAWLRSRAGDGVQVFEQRARRNVETALEKDLWRYVEILDFEREANRYVVTFRTELIRSAEGPSEVNGKPSGRVMERKRHTAILEMRLRAREVPRAALESRDLLDAGNPFGVTVMRYERSTTSAETSVGGA